MKRSLLVAGLVMAIIVFTSYGFAENFQDFSFQDFSNLNNTDFSTLFPNGIPRSPDVAPFPPQNASFGDTWTGPSGETYMLILDPETSAVLGVPVRTWAPVTSFPIDNKNNFYKEIPVAVAYDLTLLNKVDRNFIHKPDLYVFRDSIVEKEEILPLDVPFGTTWTGPSGQKYTLVYDAEQSQKWGFPVGKWVPVPAMIILDELNEVDFEAWKEWEGPPSFVPFGTRWTGPSGQEYVLIYDETETKKWGIIAGKWVRG